MTHIGSPPRSPRRGEEVALGLIGHIGLIGLIGLISLMESLTAPLPWGGVGGGSVIWPILVGNMAHIGE